MGVFPTSIQYLLLGGLGSQNRIAYALLLLPASQTEKWPPRCGDKGLWGLFYWPFFVSAGLFIFSIPSVNKQGEQPCKKYESKKTFFIAKVVHNGKKSLHSTLIFNFGKWLLISVGQWTYSKRHLHSEYFLRLTCPSEWWWGHKYTLRPYRKRKTTTSMLFSGYLSFP